MDPHRWRQIDDLFHTAIDWPPENRRSLLTQRCGADWELRNEVESLLSAHKCSSHIIDLKAFEVSPRREIPVEPDRLIGGIIGHYQIRSFIGAGGSGAVYEAEQESPRRTVALKVMRALPYRDELTARLFRREGQALARLQHPYIAAIHEAGQDEAGWHYFAMERVDGVPLTAYARKANLSIDQRLELFGRICEAVHYAHQRGVIHRDLKPSNILVTNGGQPKVLDFGLARITDPDVQLTRITESGAFHGTLAYASPEQARGSNDDIDVRSDVYSLGVILYELLTGQLPHEVRGRSLPDAARLICEEPPAPAGSINGALRGELETIVGKALEKEPSRRYSGVAALGEDIDRFLHRQPILAHRPSAAYQLRKLVARHKLPFGIAAIGLILILALSMWLLVLFVRARDSERLANQRAATATEIKDFLLQIFSAGDPDLEKGANPTATELLERSVKRVESELASEPLIQAELLNAIGSIYQKRGDYRNAITLLEKALQVRVKELGENDVATARNRADLGSALFDARQLEDSRVQFEAALPVLEAQLGPEDVILATALSGYAELVRDRDLKKAEEMHRRVLDIRRKRLGEQHPDVAESLTNVGVVLRNQGRNKEAEEHYRQALPILTAAFGEDRIVVAHTYNSLGVALKFQQRFEEAEEAYLHAQRIYRKLWNGRHVLLASSIRSVAQLQRQQGRFFEAERSFKEALQMSRELLGKENLEVAMSLELLAIMYHDELGDSAAALPLLREEHAITRKVMPGDHPRISASRSRLSQILSDLGQHEEAVMLMRDVVNTSRTSRGQQNSLNESESLALGRTLFKANQLDEAESLLQFATSELTRKSANEPFDWSLTDAECMLGQCLSRRGQEQEAQRLLLSAYQRDVARREAVTLNVRNRLLYETGQLIILNALVAHYESAHRPDEVARWKALIPDSEAVIARIREDGMKPGQRPGG